MLLSFLPFVGLRAQDRQSNFHKAGVTSVMPALCVGGSTLECPWEAILRSKTRDETKMPSNVVLRLMFDTI